ncbi:hypothetical protein [Bradyrhizobium sp. 21]|uniref:hypothetical protein n=1 Tax=Bradyrhizobium sp. 21 TaxID=2782666 RepID=UPI001FFAC43F|nr:hypothetical protein [Bradyrhizobium sp. 21]MCK1384244.1 hypothetical protein [Bradyrhizobium sp. 21]
MSIKHAALETVYSVLESPMAEDHRQIRSGSFMANAANRDVAQKIVAALLKSDVLRDETGEFPSALRSTPLKAKTIDLNGPGPAEVPEVAYRRGYQQGALDAVAAVQVHPITKVLDWVNVALAKWRFHDVTHDRGHRPPRL